MPKQKAPSTRPKRHQDPLLTQIESNESVQHEKKSKKYQRQQDEDGDVELDEETPEYLPHKISERVFREARAQKAEIEREEAMGGGESALPSTYKHNKKQVRFDDNRNSKKISLQDDDDEEESEDDEESKGMSNDALKLDGEYIEVRADPEDEALFRRFMDLEAGPRRSLADIVMNKISEKREEKEEQSMAVEDQENENNTGIDPKLVKIYSEVGEYLKRYKSGKLPKVFKILPGLSNWEELLYLTRPEEWSPHAVYAATRIFASNLDPARAQRFFNNILLPAVRDDIAASKKLNYHLYRALKKACYKPAAFYKGVLLPLCSSGNCSLREAHIVSSVVLKMSVPQIHSAATLLKLAQMRYSGAQSLFMSALINKKYTLPYRVIDAVVEHFMKFTEVEGKLPVIWHQCLLNFAQRYKQDITREQKDQMKNLLKAHYHYAITPEIRREVFNSTSRGETKVISSV